MLRRRSLLGGKMKKERLPNGLYLEGIDNKVFLLQSEDGTSQMSLNTLISLMNSNYPDKSPTQFTNGFVIVSNNFCARVARYDFITYRSAGDGGYPAGVYTPITSAPASYNTFCTNPTQIDRSWTGSPPTGVDFYGYQRREWVKYSSNYIPALYGGAYCYDYIFPDGSGDGYLPAYQELLTLIRYKSAIGRYHGTLFDTTYFVDNSSWYMSSSPAGRYNSTSKSWACIFGIKIDESFDDLSFQKECYFIPFGYYDPCVYEEVYYS